MRKLLLVLVGSVFAAMLASCGGGGGGPLAPKNLGFTPDELKEKLTTGELAVRLPESRFTKDKDGKDVFYFSNKQTGLIVGGNVDSGGRVHAAFASVPYPAISFLSSQQMGVAMSGILRATSPDITVRKAADMVVQVWNDLPKTKGAKPNVFALDGKAYSALLEPHQGGMRAFFMVCVIGVDFCKTAEASAAK